MQAGLVLVDDHAATGGNGANQVVELALDGFQVFKDVGVIELEVVEQRRAGTVVHEFAALVEEGGVVFVGFDDEQGARRERGAGAQPGRDTEIQRHPAHQKTRLQASGLQNPAQHGRGGGFAVGACHRQHMTRLCGRMQHMLGQPLRTAGVGRTRLQNRLHQGKLGLTLRRARPRHHVADHEQVGLQGHLVLAKAFDQVDAQGAQLVAHGRVDPCVAACDPMTRFACQGGHAAHEGAANPQNMNVHGLDSRGAWPH